MLPPLLLDVHPHHHVSLSTFFCNIHLDRLQVIDLCAAPGSKAFANTIFFLLLTDKSQTAQILEALHANDSVTSTSIPPGLLIANDNDHKRTHLLVHQSARLPSPALMVTNLDASIYPALKGAHTGAESKQAVLLFDRILCDVPCSGDGTLRKNIGIWKSWQSNDGNGLHGHAFCEHFLKL